MCQGLRFLYRGPMIQTPDDSPTDLAGHKRVCRRSRSFSKILLSTTWGIALTPAADSLLIVYDVGFNHVPQFGFLLWTMVLFESVTVQQKCCTIDIPRCGIFEWSTDVAMSLIPYSNPLHPKGAVANPTTRATGVPDVRRPLWRSALPGDRTRRTPTVSNLRRPQLRPSL